MKKVHPGLLASASAFLLVACGGGGSDEDRNTTTRTAEVEAPEETTSTEPSTGANEASGALAIDDITTLDGTTLADFTADAVAGERVFLQCRSCHVLEAGVNRVGPSLAGIFGRTAGTIEGFNYTEANANSGIIWTPEKMFQYLENPQRAIPGTRMAFAGLRNGQDRADIIAYLQTAE